MSTILNGILITPAETASDPAYRLELSSYAQKMGVRWAP